MIFAWNIRTEMSEWRLNKYQNISISDLTETRKISETDYTIEDLQINNVEKQADGTYKVLQEAPPIVSMNCGSISENDNIVTKITINSTGGYLFDKMTVYWKEKNTDAFSENAVYNFPINFFEKEKTIYVDGDCTEFMIVPVVYRGGKFGIENIKIEKYIGG